MWTYIARQAKSFDTRLKFTLPNWTIILGVPILIIGITITIICLYEFVIYGKGTLAHFDPPEKFVAIGPYKYVRNPMYLGVLLIFIGYALFVHSISVLFLSLALFLLAHIIVVFIEEPGLKEKFGNDYMNYTKAVNRWFPRIQKR
jgi:protein-S-isoprenylcysteine O-methyltransferase Ste14